MKFNIKSNGMLTSFTMNLTTVLPLLDNGLPKSMFSWFDYLIFTGILGFSVLIGVYFWCFGSKQDTATEYLLGGRNMSVLPIAASLMASHVSGTTLLAIPADIYKFGSNFWWLCLSLAFVCAITAFIFLPVLYDLQLTSMFEYLSLRFDEKTKLFASFLFLMSVFIYSSIIIYAPALAFSQVSGVNVHYITPVLCGVCIFYTTIGGLKAVVWTDALQFVGIIGSVIGILVIGINAGGGLTVVWNKAVAGERLDMFDFRFDPTLRDSFWGVVFGGTLHWLTIVFAHQGSMQKFWSLPTLKHAKQSLLVYYIGMLFTLSLCVLIGNTMYARYADCDPFTSGQIKHADQLLPLFVMDVAGDIPGLPGIFTAGVFSAGLSSLSATLNTMSGIIYKDFATLILPSHLTDHQITNILKLLVVICGVICTILIFLVENMGGIFPLITTFHGVFAGSLFGLFVLGMLFPVANATGAWFGGLSGFLFVLWMAIGNQWYKFQGISSDQSKPLSTSGCPFFVNETSPITLVMEQPFIMYRVSFWYYTFTSITIIITVGVIISYFTNKEKKAVSYKLISPLTHFLLSLKGTKSLSPYIDYYSIDNALKIVTVNTDKCDESTKESD